MPLYMDIHNVPGVKSIDVASAHYQDLIHQETYGCNCMTYWIDEERESIFCLVEAADKDAVKNMHSKAHGLVPHKIIEVSSAIVKSFLGRIYDPEDAVMEDNLKVFSDPAYRLLLITQTEDHTLLKHQHGDKRATDLLHKLNEIVRRNLLLHKGSETEHEGEGFIVSFVSAHDAVQCALAIQNDMTKRDSALLNFRMALNGGEPIEKSSQLFGDTIQMGNYLCMLTGPEKIVIAGKIKDLVSKELQQTKKASLLSLSLPDQDFIHAFFSKMEKKFADPEFEVPEYAEALSMSQPQLYRRTTSVTGKSSNILLKEFRLKKALEMMRTQRYSVSQVSFDSGFSSPSYFTKVFKSSFNLLPGEYMDLLKQA